jgi:hypothetical protein
MKRMAKEEGLLNPKKVRRRVKKIISICRSYIK